VNPTDVPFFRYPIPRRVCRCGCAFEGHNISTKAQACSSCDCPGFTLAELHWTEKRTVVEQVR
jgi:hypothetical protein